MTISLAASTQETIHALRLKNGAIAETILANPISFKMACERNRVTEKKLLGAHAYLLQDRLIQQLVKELADNPSSLQIPALECSNHIKAYYPHLVRHLPDKDERRQLIRELSQVADVARRETALEQFGLPARAAINQIMHFKRLDYQCTTLINNLATLEDSSKQQLHSLQAARDKVAFNLYQDPSIELWQHFVIEETRLKKYAASYQDRVTVERWATLMKANPSSLVTIHLAHRIKTEPKRYGRHIHAVLNGDWKSLNLENWRYQRRRTVSQLSDAEKKCHRDIQAYKAVAKASYQAWQKAFQSNHLTPEKKQWAFKKAEHFIYQRLKLAKDLAEQLSKYPTIFADERMDAERLQQEANVVAFLHRYQTTEKAPLKLQMAAYLQHHLKDYRAGLAVLGLSQEVFENSARYHYLKQLHASETLAMKEAIRLSYHYQQHSTDIRATQEHLKRITAAGLAHEHLKAQSQRLFAARDACAFKLDQCLQANPNLSSQLTELNLDDNRIKQQALTHTLRERIINYPKMNAAEKLTTAQRLLNDKRAYRLLHDYQLDTKTLKQTLKATPCHTVHHSTHVPSKERFDYETINEALRCNPRETYTAILGQPKSSDARTLKYSSGLIVTPQGHRSGFWYSFTEEKGGGPIQAIQHFQNLTFQEALKAGATLAGISPTSDYRLLPKILPSKVTLAEDTSISQRIATAQSIWAGSVAPQGTLAERYFKDHRGLDTITNLAIRYWPKGAKWIDYDAQGNRTIKVNQTPAVLIAAKDATGQITGVQRIYLDEQTATKHQKMQNPKLSKGITKGSPGVIQLGDQKDIIYIAEGPETAASIAAIRPNYTVLASFSVSNLANLGPVIKNYAPKTVVIAADNDGPDAPSRKTTEQAVLELRKQGFRCVAVYPKTVSHNKKTDWNDVLRSLGKPSFTQVFNHKEQSALASLQLTGAQQQKQHRDDKLAQLKQTYPILKEYESLHRQRTKVTGYRAEQLEKQLKTMAKRIMADKTLSAQLKQELPKLAQRLLHQIQGKEIKGWER